jgi:hypothetical protein
LCPPFKSPQDLNTTKSDHFLSELESQVFRIKVGTKRRAHSTFLVRDRTIYGLIEEDWYRYLENDKDIPMDKIRLATRTGRPAGDQYFTNTIEQLTSRSLQKGKPGRPRKQKL